MSIPTAPAVFASLPERSSSSCSTLEQQAPQDSRTDGKTTYNRRTNQTLLLHLFVDQLLQARALQVLGLNLQQSFIVSSCLCVVAQFVVAKCQVV